MHPLLFLGPILITTGSFLSIFLLTNPKSSPDTRDDPIQLSTSKPEPVYGAKMGCENEWCTWNYWTHYEAKGCEPVYDTPASCCPSRFNCPKVTRNSTGCTYKGRSYAVSSNIDTIECRVCTCAPGRTAERPRIVCKSIYCPDVWNRIKPGCRLTYREDRCCPMGLDCTPTIKPAITTTTTTTTTLRPVAECFVGNRSYVRGESITFDDDVCIRCTCVPGFQGPNGPGCKRVDNDCLLQYQEYTDIGCIPIYFKGQCCPSYFRCPEDPPPDQTAAMPSELTADGCTFDGRHYARGARLDASDREGAPTCTCTCITPPEFTCIK